MRKQLQLAIIGLVALCANPLAYAADHVDAPSVEFDSSADINDLYAWVDGDGKLNLVMTIGGVSNLAAFSDSTQYVFHVSSGDQHHTVMCTFAADQTISCWGAGEYVSGDATNEAGVVSETGGLRVFAGQRNDPFFMSDGMADFFDAVRQRAPAFSYSSDAPGCPELDNDTTEQLLDILRKSPDQPAENPTADANVDLYEGNTVLGIVAQLDVGKVAGDNNNLRVWATTRR